jgi:ureidoacrylate peracid hydrolase
MTVDLSTLNLATSGLLVIDMQNAFCHPCGTLRRDGADVGGIQRMLDPLTKVIMACQTAGIRDFWSVQEYYEYDATRHQHRLFSHTLNRFRVPCIKGSWDSELVDELQPLLTNRSEVFRKNRFGCFYNTRLPTLLRVHGIDTLVVTGVDINICVDTTVREAYMHDLDVIVLSDCVGGAHKSWHAMAHEVWERYFGVVVSSDVLLSLIEGQPKEATNGIRRVVE